MDMTNRQSLKQRFCSYLRSPLSLVLLLLVTAAAAVTVFVLVFLILYILMKEIPYLTPSLFAWEYNSGNVSLTLALVNTIMITMLALLIVTPLGVFATIYLVEHAKRGNKVVKVVHVTTEILLGIPSTAYGLFGFLLFGVTLKRGYSFVGGAPTLATMILSPIMRTTEEALKPVPDSYREGNFGLGAGRLRTVFKIVLPSAVLGTLAGVTLAIERVVGETAAFMYAAETAADTPDNPIGSGCTLAVYMYMLTNEGLYTNQSYATVVALLAIVAVINALSGFIAKQIGKGKN